MSTFSMLLCLVLCAGQLKAHTSPGKTGEFSEFHSSTFFDELLRDIDKACYSVGVTWWLDKDDKYPDERLAKEAKLERGLSNILQPLLEDFNVSIAECVDDDKRKDTEAQIHISVYAKKSEDGVGARLEISVIVWERIKSLRTDEILTIVVVSTEHTSNQIPFERLEADIYKKTKMVVVLTGSRFKQPSLGVR